MTLESNPAVAFMVERNRRIDAPVTWTPRLGIKGISELNHPLIIHIVTTRFFNSPLAARSISLSILF